MYDASEKMNQRRHELAKLIPAAKDETAKVTLKTESHQLKQAIAHKSAALEQSVCALEVEAAKLPNETSPQTPIGERGTFGTACIDDTHSRQAQRAPLL